LELFGPPGAPPTSVRVQFGGSTADSMVRIPAWRPAPADLRALAGRYWSDELGALYEIVQRDSAVWLRRPKNEDAPLRPAFVDGFLVPGLGTVRIVRNGKQATGLSVTGGRVRNIAFVRLPAGSPVR
jgi:hypothetical protein